MCIFVCMITVLFGQNLPALPVEEIEKRAVLSRTSIKQGVLEYVLIADESKPAEAILHRVWFDHLKKKARLDRFFPRAPPQTFRDVMCDNCVLEGFAFSHKFIDEKDSILAASLTPLKPGGTIGADFRGIGFLPDGPEFLGHPIDKYQVTSDRKNLQLRQEKYRDIECYVVSFEWSDRGTITYWLAPEQNFSPVKILFYDQKNKIKTLTENNNHKVSSSIWFPKKTIYTVYEDEVVKSRSSIFVKEITLNTDVAPEMFELGGIELPAGHPISVTTKKGEHKLMQWREGKLIPFQTADAPTPFPRTPPQTSNQSLYTYLLVAGLALAAVLSLYAYFRFSAQPRK